MMLLYIIAIDWKE